jgi:uncharacterized protein (TIGR02444 family)
VISAWDHARAVWRRPGVEALCLDLQQRRGQCIVLLLWRLWAEAETRAVDRETLMAAVDLARDWETHVLGPLRGVRQALRSPGRPIAAAASDEVRHQALATELTAERVLLDALEDLTPRDRAASVRLDDALTGLMALWGDVAPQAEIAALLELL